MRVGIVRTDLGKGVYLADIESAVQRNFSSEPPGQSRNIRRPTDAELDAVLNLYPLPASLTGSDTAVNVDTSVNDTLRIRSSAALAYTVIAVTSGAATAKTVIRDDLTAARHATRVSGNVAATARPSTVCNAPAEGVPALISI